MELSSKVKLAVFDFDATIIHDNSDTYINDMLIKKYNAHKERLGDEANLSDIDLRRFIYPPSIEELYSKFNWPTRMNAALEYIHSKFACGSTEILDRLKEVKIEESMKQLFKKLWENEYDIVILSDANVLFIETILEANGLLDNFTDRVISNRTYLDENGVLKITPYYLENKHDQMPFDCIHCVEDCGEPSICKKELLEALIQKRKDLKKVVDEQAHVVYVGDGRNDYCPGLVLNENDLYFPRKGYNLAKLLESEQHFNRIKAKVSYWENAEEIISQLDIHF